MHITQLNATGPLTLHNSTQQVHSHYTTQRNRSAHITQQVRSHYTTQRNRAAHITQQVRSHYTTQRNRCAHITQLNATGPLTLHNSRHQVRSHYTTQCNRSAHITTFNATGPLTLHNMSAHITQQVRSHYTTQLNRSAHITQLNATGPLTLHNKSWLYRVRIVALTVDLLKLNLIGKKTWMLHCDWPVAPTIVASNWRYAYVTYRRIDGVHSSAISVGLVLAMHAHYHIKSAQLPTKVV